MERIRKPNEPLKIQWLKTGGGFFVIPGKRIIKPGQVFWASEDEIPLAFRDQVKPLNQEEAQKIAPVPDAELPVVEPAYTKKARIEGGIWYDIVDKQGKVVNEKALREEQADEMLKALMP